MLETRILDLSSCKTSDEVKAAADVFWRDEHPLPEEPEANLYRPAIIKAANGRVWFETVIDVSRYSRSYDPAFHLRTHSLKDDEQMVLKEVKVLHEELGKAIAALEQLQGYAAAHQAWEDAIDQDKRDLGVFQNECLKTWSEHLKKK